MLYLCLDCGNVFDSKYTTMKKSNAAMYEYICPLASCGGTCVEIDENIIEPIRMLNNKGYRTKFSCAGHVFSKESAYVAFDQYLYPENYLDLPKGWKADKFVGWGNYIIRYEIKGDLNSKERFLDQFNAMKNLMDWAESLPERTIEHNARLSAERLKELKDFNDGFDY